MHKRERIFADFIQGRKKDYIFRHLKNITPINSREINVDEHHYVNVSSNDYLGLSHDIRLIEAASKASEKYGAGSGASRLVTGNIDLFEIIEDKVANFKGKEAALIMVSGYQANASVLPALFDKTVHKNEPLIFADKLNHASMHAGCAAAGIRQIRYAHNDMEHLETLLNKYKDSDTPKFILTESVFSMDGDTAPLDEIDVLAKKHDAFVIVDEAHASGVLGENGKGLADKADMVIGTFGKAFGSFGAYIACSHVMKDYLINKCGGLIYATALPPATLGSINAALDIVPTMHAERKHLQTLAQTLREGLHANGFETGPSSTQIVPVIIGDAAKTLGISENLKQSGFWATAIRPPTVPDNASRIRIALSAAHTQEDITRLINGFCVMQ